MRISAIFLAPLLLLVLPAATLAVAQASDATLFYAPPTETIPPVMLKAHREAAKRPQPPHGRLCFNHEEARERVSALGLAEPYRALRAGRLQGEALRAKLCRWKQDEFVYEVAVLRRDGRIVHVYMDALSGKDVEP